MMALNRWWRVVAKHVAHVTTRTREPGAMDERRCSTAVVLPPPTPTIAASSPAAIAADGGGEEGDAGKDAGKDKDDNDPAAPYRPTRNFAADPVFSVAVNSASSVLDRLVDAALATRADATQFIAQMDQLRAVGAERLSKHNAVLLMVRMLAECAKRRIRVLDARFAAKLRAKGHGTDQLDCETCAVAASSSGDCRRPHGRGSGAARACSTARAASPP